MNLSVRRGPCTMTDPCVIGELWDDDAKERICYTLEDVVREDGRPVAEWKVQDATAIPRGTYPVIVNYSQRFRRLMPLLVDVPGFTGIRIHPGNFAQNTDGCILVGFGKTETTITDSLNAFGAVYQRISEALLRGEPVSISVQ